MPLHIFEPRYRAMVRDCVERGLPLGVALAVRKIAPSHGAHDLRTNLATYEPSAIFGAGPVELQRELPDGRFLIEVHAKERVRLVEVVQRVPYMTAEVEPLPYPTSAPSVAATLAARVRERARELWGEEAEDALAALNTTELSFRIVGWLDIPGALGQALLEASDEATLLATLLGWLDLVAQRTKPRTDNVTPLFPPPRPPSP